MGPVWDFLEGTIIVTYVTSALKTWRRSEHYKNAWNTDATHVRWQWHHTFFCWQRVSRNLVATLHRYTVAQHKVNNSVFSSSSIHFLRIGVSHFRYLLIHDVWCWSCFLALEKVSLALSVDATLCSPDKDCWLKSFFLVHFHDFWFQHSQEKLSAKDKNSLEASGWPPADQRSRGLGSTFYRWKVAQLEAIDNINGCVLEHLQEMGALWLQVATFE